MDPDKQCLETLILSHNDLLIIRSSLIKTRKTQGSVRADEIIADIDERLSRKNQKLPFE